MTDVARLRELARQAGIQWKHFKNATTTTYCGGQFHCQLGQWLGRPAIALVAKGKIVALIFTRRGWALEISMSYQPINPSEFLPQRWITKVFPTSWEPMPKFCVTEDD